MKKVFATLAVCAFAFAFAACGAKKEEANDKDTLVVVETSTIDTTVVLVDTVKHDTVK